MPEFFLELFSEEIPARMQRDASIQLERICNDVLRSVKINLVETFYGPRRIAIKAHVTAKSDAKIIEERGPRDTAPDAALAGFLGKHKASREEVLIEGGYYWLRRNENPVAATELIAAGLPPALAKFSWPKSMRWGQGGDFTWVRPLRRVVCLLDGEVIPFKLGPVNASNETEGHRFLAPGVFTVSSAADWEEKLKKRFVIADQTKRRQLIVDRIAEKAGELGLNVVEDSGLIDEVNGLVEWPVSLIGKIDEDFMNLPPEVRELSMKVNQRYFALRDEAGGPAPYFAFVSNIETEDGGRAIIAGNERVLRARLSDARHFWDLDIKTPLIDLLPKLDTVTYHAKLGSQGARVKRLIDGVFRIGSQFGGLFRYTNHLSQRAAKLAKCDLVTGMVSEFPELQGVIGSYYAQKNGEPAEVVEALRMQYSPKGPKDGVPKSAVAINLALADKFDQIVGFFDIGERPTGSGDPYALRRAALGIIRIILENRLVFDIKPVIHCALEEVRQAPAINVSDAKLEGDIFEFIIDRLRALLRSDGKRFDILDAVFGKSVDGNITRLMKKVDALADFLATPDGTNLLIAYRRAVNILRIEDAKDGPHIFDTVHRNYGSIEANDLRDALDNNTTVSEFNAGNYAPLIMWLAKLRSPVDAFFDHVAINDPDPEIRRNHLRLLAHLRDTMHLIADFSKMDG